ncbi:MAG: ATP-binding protein [Gemmatimonadaceae bacterium]|nr:ATP-binding protein [Gemmatimonadaceae bacterium]
MLHIVLTGSESVGKTTLAVALGAHYGALVVPEFVRDYVANKGEPLDFRDHGPIAHGQMALADERTAVATQRGDALLLHDTDLVSTVVYCHHYFGRCPEFIEQAAVARRPARYLLLDIDVPWVPDGIRDRGDRREEVHALFSETLSRLGAPVTPIRGSYAERFEKAIATIDHMLSESTHT